MDSEKSFLRDVQVSMSGYDLFLSDEVVPIDAVCVNDGSKISNSDEWYFTSVKYVEDAECGEREEFD